MTTNQEALKPCPFCNDTPELMYFGDYVIFCKCGGGMNKQFHESEDAIAAWNRRAAPVAPSAQPEGEWVGAKEHWSAPVAAQPMPDGWTIERADQKPFKFILIKAPNGAVTHASNIGRNPENILYMLAEALLANRPTATSAAQPVAWAVKHLFDDARFERVTLHESDVSHIGTHRIVPCYAAPVAAQPIAWRREWNGDDSDIGQWIYAEIAQNAAKDQNK